MNTFEYKPYRPVSFVSFVVNQSCAHEVEARNTERLVAGRDDPVVRARGISSVCQLALVLSVDRRSGNRVHAHSRAGDGAVRVGRCAGCRPHWPGLDCRARAGRRQDGCSDLGGRCHLCQAKLRQGSLGAGRAGRLRRPDRGRSEGSHDRYRARPRLPRLFRGARHQRQRRVLVGGHGSETAGARGRHR